MARAGLRPKPPPTIVVVVAIVVVVETVHWRCEVIVCDNEYYDEEKKGSLTGMSVKHDRMKANRPTPSLDNKEYDHFSSPPSECLGQSQPCLPRGVLYPFYHTGLRKESLRTQFFVKLVKKAGLNPVSPFRNSFQRPLDIPNWSSQLQARPGYSSPRHC